MSTRLRMMLAAVLAVACGGAVYAFLASLRPSHPVVVLATDIPPRTPITSDLIRVEYVEESSRNALAPDAYSSAKEVENLVAVRNLRKGEVLRRTGEQVTTVEKLGSLTPGQTVAVSELIPKGMRAVSLPVSGNRIVRAGDRVDLFGSVGQGGGAQVALLLPGVTVFMAPGDDKAAASNEITVLVKEGEDVRRLVEALRLGDVDVVLAPAAVG